ncbi:MAG: DUF1501 domain-containing protein [Microscillaceae bacterium]|nr:DUF1501 domain-containing protein [Microscillaceae bacterium]
MCHKYTQYYSRRDFLAKTALGLGAASLTSLMDPFGLWGKTSPKITEIEALGRGVLGQPHFAPKAKRVIYLFQSGAPSQLELFDYKPLLNKMTGEELPESVRKGQRLTGMTAGQSSFPLVGSKFAFRQHGQSAAWVSELMPYTSQIVDELCFIKSMYTEAINHDPAATFIQSGSQFSGRPSIGSWISYGLGSDNENLPAYVVLVTQGKTGQPLYARMWGNGFLPSEHQGVQFRAGKNPVLYLSNPGGIDPENRKEQLDYLKKLQELQLQEVMDPEIEARIAQYEMAYRMQTSVPEIMDTSGEPEHIYEMYGEDSRKPGTFAANCLLARRLAEKDVKFIQLFHRDWDHHGNLPNAIPERCKETDQATAALIMDLKQRGLLDDTLVIWGGEFGRTNYSQGKLTETNYGRDHHPKSFTIFMAGAGVKKGLTYGATDDFGYDVVQNPVHVHDLQATILHLMGIHHEKLTYKFQGRRYRLTDVHGKVVHDILA